MVKFISSVAFLGFASSMPNNDIGPEPTIPKLVSQHGNIDGGQQRSYAQQSENGRYYLESPNFNYWMDTKDDILSEFKNYMQQAEKRLGATYMDSEQDKSLKTLQRFAELVDMIMYLQKVPFFGQYWYYGCWCAPEGFFKTERQGYGTPVDKIDKSCRSMSYCYECAQLDHGSECNTEEVSYRWHGAIVDGKKEVYCDDEPGTCEHSLCSCDRNLAQELALHEDDWNLHHHHKWGEFNRDKCFITPEQAQIRAAERAGNSGPAEEPEADIGARSFGNLADGNVPAITLKFASAFANPEEKYCCGEYGSMVNKRVPLRRYNNNGDMHNERCCVKKNDASIDNVFTGSVFKINAQQCCDSSTGTVHKTDEAATCDSQIDLL